jgi:uncharacterized protein (DUF924 family)
VIAEEKVLKTAQDVLAFWLDSIQPEKWYAEDPALDDKIRAEFLSTWQAAHDGAHGLWLTCASETLAYIILTDQFPRNMFRGKAQAFSTDRNAIAAAKMAINKGWDMKIDPPARQFFYLPLMHAENLEDQERAVRLFLTRMPDAGAGNINHACAHREVIRRFGRFPYRNTALGRKTGAAEKAFLTEGGYGTVLRELQAEKMAK